MTDDHTIELKDGTRILVVDGEGKPFPLTEKMREILEQEMPTLKEMAREAEGLLVDHKPGDFILFAEQETTRALRHLQKTLLDAPLVMPDSHGPDLITRVFEALEPPPEPMDPPKPPKPPKPRRTKRERRGSWKR